jgi:hypothetical protein
MKMMVDDFTGALMMLTASMPNSRSELRVIHCIGDSHSSFFSGTWDIQPEWPGQAADRLPGVFSCRLGAATAHNLIEPGSSTRSSERLWEALRTIPASPDHLVLLSFGEIDCRVHLPRLHAKTGVALQELVRCTVRRYTEAVMKVVEAGYRVALWAPVASSNLEGGAGLAYVCHGTCAERNRITRLFNDHLAEACRAAGVPLVSVFERLISGGGRTRFEYYADDVHLSPLSLPLASRAIEAACPGFRLPLSWWQRHLAPFQLILRQCRLIWRAGRLRLKKKIASRRL